MADKLQVRLLGGFEASLGDGNPLILKGRKTQALLAMLALLPGTAVSREKLTNLLWSDRGDEQARGSLRQALAELRKAIADLDPSSLITDRETVHLDAKAIEVDALTFESLIDDGTPDALARAAELYQGDLLDGFDVRDAAFEEWLRDERERFRERAGAVLSRLVDHQKGDEAIATARRLLALDPLNEASHRTLMRFYAAGGDRRMALKQYEACRDLLRVELELKPDTETERLLHDTRDGGTAVDETAESATAVPAAATEPLPLPDKPSIAVLPFVNISGDAEQEYFADGITEDITTELSRFRSLFVIARNSSFTFKGQAVDVTEVGRRLGVSYVVEGSVRKVRNRVRISAQLVEAKTGNHVWAERYDRDLEDIFAVQDEVVRTITSTIGGRVEFAGQKRVERLSKRNLLAYDHVLRAHAAYLRGNKQDNRDARDLVEQAIDLDPLNAQAHRLLAEVHVMDWMAHWVEDRAATLVDAFESAKTAVMLDDSFSGALATLGGIQLYRREYEDAQHTFERAIELNPNDSETLDLYAMYLVAVGRVDEALAQHEFSERNNPFQAFWVVWLRGIAFFTARRYDEAISILRTIKDPVNEMRGWLAASYAGAGRLDEARAMLEDFLRVAEDDMAVFPGRKLAAWEPFWHGAIEYQNDADFEHLYDALRKAGFED